MGDPADSIRQRLRRFKWQPSGTLGVRALGHRRFVGAHWEQMGQLQFDFMCSHGLTPGHVLVDVACGSLRAGRLFIPYLAPGHYLGIERESALIKAGLASELSSDIVAAKKPEFLIDSRFNFRDFTRKPDFGIANSLFSHLNAADISLCLSNLRAFAPECRFFATFRPSDGRRNPRRSTAHADFRYTPDEIAHLGRESGWRTEYLGDWSHPTGQHMMAFS